MYLVTWNPEEACLEASLGGKITREEATVFRNEVLLLLGAMEDVQCVLLDYSLACNFEDGVSNLIAEVHEASHQMGVSKVVVAARDEEHLARLVEQRSALVAAGREEYRLTGTGV